MAGTTATGEEPHPFSLSVKLSLVVGPILALIPFLYDPPGDLKVGAWRLIGLTLWMVAWWITEAVPIPATALLPIPFMPLLGIAGQKTVTSSYAHPLIYLFFGGFMIAAAMQRWGLHRRIALTTVNVLGTSPSGIIGSFMLAVFILTALFWIFRKWLVRMSGVDFSDTTIAMVAAIVLFMLPVSLQEKKFVLDWKSGKQIHWGVLILFGGGLALAGAFKSTGLAESIGNLVKGWQEINPWLIVLMVTTIVVFLTELTSNTATAATFLPIMGAVALGFGKNPLLLTIPVTIAASAAFMLPVATPPNAIVFAYEELKVSDMVKAGIALNIFAILTIMLLMYFLVVPLLSTIFNFVP
ncbi:MAG: SLC13 family permease [bacterium]|nr:SLC13 family permease [bacterium]